MQLVCLLASYANIYKTLAVQLVQNWPKFKKQASSFTGLQREQNILLHATYCTVLSFI